MWPLATVVAIGYWLLQLLLAAAVATVVATAVVDSGYCSARSLNFGAHWLQLQYSLLQCLKLQQQLLATALNLAAEITPRMGFCV